MRNIESIELKVENREDGSLRLSWGDDPLDFLIIDAANRETLTLHNFLRLIPLGFAL